MASFLKVNLFTLSLLLSWSCTAPSAAFPPRPPSALIAADTLRTRGYAIFASLLVSISSSTNFSGTLLAPPDFAFSFAATKILNNHRPPPRPSLPSLLYHTFRPPLILSWHKLSSRYDGEELPTFYNNFCLHLFRNPHAGEIAISSSPFRNPSSSVKIRQPDLYVDDHLTVHGIDGVLNPSLGTRCSVTRRDPTVETVPTQVKRVFLGHAMRALRRKGYHAMAAAMGVRKSDLLPLTSVTVFAISDEHLFLTNGGFHFDFRHHVVPIRYRLHDLANLMAGDRAEFFTLSPNQTVSVVSNDGAVTVDGVPVGVKEVYYNRWIVVVSVNSSLDDAAVPPSSAPSPSPSPIHSVPSPAPIHDGSTSSVWDGNAPGSNPSPSPTPKMEIPVSSTAVSPSPGAEVAPCDINLVVSNGIEGGDLLCTDTEVRKLPVMVTVDVEGYQPLDAEDLSRSRIDDDVYYYT